MRLIWAWTFIPLVNRAWWPALGIFLGMALIQTGQNDVKIHIPNEEHFFHIPQSPSDTLSWILDDNCCLELMDFPYHIKEVAILCPFLPQINSPTIFLFKYQYCACFDSDKIILLNPFVGNFVRLMSHAHNSDFIGHILDWLHKMSISSWLSSLMKALCSWGKDSILLSISL